MTARPQLQGADTQRGV
ncbi:hypothetical protein E2C01_066374 [Portunus trituberculatus]|uniref:Uncharacterized protein n=1 Tax=Portunus trituberculatus TaxID=210409 RepID=A0A5B7HGW5_PORTR|nr:hypothetical protein [Portunus trituberculatus]